MRLCPNILAATAAALVLITQITPARAESETVKGTLTFPNGLPAADPNATKPQVVLDLANPGAIVPAAPTTDNPKGNPMLIDNAGSKGFDPTGVVDLLSKDNKQFGLSFFGTGIQPGGTLAFSLNVDKALSGLPIFQYASGIDDTLGASAPVTLPTPKPTTDPTPKPTHDPTPTPDPTPKPTHDPTPTPDPTPHVETPEPVSLLLWSAMGGIGLWHARRRGRTPALPS